MGIEQATVRKQSRVSLFMAVGELLLHQRNFLFKNFFYYYLFMIRSIGSGISAPHYPVPLSPWLLLKEIFFGKSFQRERQTVGAPVSFLGQCLLSCSLSDSLALSPWGQLSVAARSWMAVRSYLNSFNSVLFLWDVFLLSRLFSSLLFFFYLMFFFYNKKECRKKEGELTIWKMWRWTLVTQGHGYAVMYIFCWWRKILYQGRRTGQREGKFDQEGKTLLNIHFIPGNVFVQFPKGEWFPL